MPQGHPRVEEHHAWTDISHDLPHLVAVCRGITVDLAFAATRLAVAFGAAVKSPVRIVEQTAAVGTQAASRDIVMPVAIYGNHLSDNRLLALDTVHSRLLIPLFNFL